MMELTDTSRPAEISKYGDENFQVQAGKTLLIETSPSGEEILNLDVPEGKRWEVRISVNIVEMDV